MTYITIPGKEEAIKKITAALKGTDEIILATDPDREGEAIAWHVSDLLKTKHAKKIEGKEIKRAVFYEISKEAVNKARKQFAKTFRIHAKQKFRKEKINAIKSKLLVKISISANFFKFQNLSIFLGTCVLKTFILKG